LRQDQNNQHSALLCYQRALEADPTCITALQNLGYLLFNMGEAEKSRDVYDQLLALEPSPLNQLLASSVLPVIYDSPQDIDYWRDDQLAILRKLVESGGKVDATKTLVPTCFFAAYQGRSDRELMELRGKAIEGRDFTGGRTIKRSVARVKVGFMSAYFRDHTIGRLNIGRLEKLPRENVELTIVHAGISNDGLVKRFMNTADRYVTLPRDLPSAITRLAELELDILVHADVGMDALTQTLAFSRFAPIQAATWGHPDTTGSRFIDYFLTSRRLEHSNSTDQYTEQLLMLPSLGIEYERPTLTRAKSRLDLGLPTDCHLYGCPQTLFKFHPEFDQVLASILCNDPKAEVILLEGRLPEWTHRLRKRFRRTLPDADHRVRFLPSLSREEFLSLLASVDVLLDPIHFGGGNSSIESVAMGTPLVTMEGEFLRSRITSSLFQELGLEELIAGDLNDYVRMAVNIACDRDYRSNLQRRMLAAAEAFFNRHTAGKELEECLLSLVV
jgi:protein O-GlcNAc transferase